MFEVYTCKRCIDPNAEDEHSSAYIPEACICKADDGVFVLAGPIVGLPHQFAAQHIPLQTEQVRVNIQLIVIIHCKWPTVVSDSCFLPIVDN